MKCVERIFSMLKTYAVLYSSTACLICSTRFSFVSRVFFFTLVNETETNEKLRKPYYNLPSLSRLLIGMIYCTITIITTLTMSRFNKKIEKKNYFYFWEISLAFSLKRRVFVVGPRIDSFIFSA